MDSAELVVDALRLALALSAPALLACVLVTLVMSLVQAATQANDPSIGFVPKWLAVLVALFLSRGLIAERLVGFAARMLHDIGRVGG